MNGDRGGFLDRGSYPGKYAGLSSKDGDPQIRPRYLGMEKFAGGAVRDVGVSSLVNGRCRMMQDVVAFAKVSYFLFLPPLHYGCRTLGC
jgi:hypothetical protein